MIGGFSVPGRQGPGSGNHWTDNNSDAARDYFLMSGADFLSKYQVLPSAVVFRNGKAGYYINSNGGEYGGYTTDGDGVREFKNSVEIVSTFVPFAQQKNQILQAEFMSDFGWSGVDLVIGAASHQLGKDIDKGSGWFKGKPAWGEKWKVNNPRVRITNPIKNFSANAGKTLKVASVLKVGGLALGGYGLYTTYTDWRDKKISNGEAALDAAAGVIGFLGSRGMVVSATYFLLAKPLYNYATSDD